MVDGKQKEVVEIEEYAKNGKEVPSQGVSYRLRVDKEKVVVDVDRLTGRQILALVNMTPEADKLYQHVKGQQPKVVEADETVIFTSKGLERFSTVARDTTEGKRG